MAVVNNPKLYTNTRDLSSQKFVAGQNMPTKEAKVDEALKQYLSKFENKSKMPVKQKEIIEVVKETVPEFKEEKEVLPEFKEEKKTEEILFETTEEIVENIIEEDGEDKSGGNNHSKTYNKNKKFKK